MPNETITDPYLIETYEHIGIVRSWIDEAASNLDRRTLNHDASKLVEPEITGFKKMAKEMRLSDTTYGSPEYRAILKKYKPTAIGHHYEVNDHHPEHYLTSPSYSHSYSAVVEDKVANGYCVSGMSLMSLIEMLCDWKAATARMKDGDMVASLEHNRERFGIEGQLQSILLNTARELGMLEEDPGEYRGPENRGDG